MASEKVDPILVEEKSNDGSLYPNEMTWTEEEEKRVRNKLDWQIVPTVTILYLMCFLDR